MVAPGSRTCRPVSSCPASARLNASVTWLTGSAQKKGRPGGVKTTRQSSGGPAVMARLAPRSGHAMTARRLQPTKQLSRATASTATPRDGSAGAVGEASVAGSISSSVSQMVRTSAVIVVRGVRARPRPRCAVALAPVAGDRAPDRRRDREARAVRPQGDQLHRRATSWHSLGRASGNRNEDAGKRLTHVERGRMFMVRYASYPSLEDRVVFVTGGGSGIGASVVEHLCAQRARVAFVDIQREASDALVARIAAGGLPAPAFIRCDLRDIAALRAAIAEVE